MNPVLSNMSSKRKPVDLFILGQFQDEKPSFQLASLEPEFAKTVKTAISKGRFTGKFGETLSAYDGSNREAAEVVLLGLGKKRSYKTLCFRKAAAKTIDLAKAAKAKSVRILLDSFCTGGVKAVDAAGIFAETKVLAQYDFSRHKSKAAKSDAPKREIIFEIMFGKASAARQAQKAVERSLTIAEGVSLARNFINEPGNILNPPRLVKEARDLAKRKKLSCQILGEPELKRLRMGGILAVNQGSTSPASLIILEHGKNYKNRGTVCLVGKGVTFDTGGISLKPSRDMEKMKYDMSGAAAVIASMGVIADLKIPLHVVGITPTVENMVAENPQRPGDIIRMFNGKTVEVLNTDAEGRLILGDALAYSEKFKPKAIIDLATLTGACVMTFGDKAVAVLGNDEKLISRVKKAGESVEERCWQLPLWPEYGELIKGHHSDLYNIGGPYGGTITAAMFLKEFVPENTPWVHLDIAGTAWSIGGRYDCPKGATGVGVRLLAELFTNWRK